LIPQETISRIFDTARIEEVVGDFVQLKKSGSNYKGLSPWTNERTPSFMVSPAKGIFKDFSSGKGGNVVTFLMELEHFSYPEALRWLANRYGIEVEEEEQTPEQIKAKNKRESLYIVNKFARDWFAEQMHQTAEGKSIGLSYFKQRGFSAEIIKKFELGFSPESRDALSSAALKNGYQKEYLIETGLSIELDNPKGALLDRFRGRVIFPIHDVSGRIAGFGGRILRTDKKTAKYLNSPESEIYHKSKFLFGIYFAKQAIVKADECYLVEGYTDVLSMHQAGLENVAASSGTALTQEQIRMVRRYTPNLTILYDSDPAGIKASFRGIDMALEEGMNVRVVLFPEGEDPDSFSQKHSQEELEKYIAANRKDFIHFKAGILGEEAKGDPIKKSELIREILQSISKIPDRIAREVYVRETGVIFDMSEQVLHSELARILNKKRRDQSKQEQKQQEEEAFQVVRPSEAKQAQPAEGDYEQEKGLISLILNHGNERIVVEWEGQSEEVTVAEEIVAELHTDELSFNHPVFQRIYTTVAQKIENGELWSLNDFTDRDEDPDVKSMAVELTFEKYELADWDKRQIIVPKPVERVKRDLEERILHFKRKRILQIMNANMQKMKEGFETEEDRDRIYEQQMKFRQMLLELDKRFGRVV